MSSSCSRTRAASQTGFLAVVVRRVAIAFSTSAYLARYSSGVRPYQDTSEYPAAARAACSRSDATRLAGIWPSASTRRASTSPGGRADADGERRSGRALERPAAKHRSPVAGRPPAACRSSAVPIPRRRHDGSTSKNR